MSTNANPALELEIDDAELARRSVIGFGELLAALGRSSAGPGAEVRRPDALGARIDSAADNPFFNAAIVPAGATPPNDDPDLPYCVWSVGGAVPGRVEEPEIATPCMGVVLDDPALALNGAVAHVQAPSLAVLGDINERAYGESGWFSALLATLRDDRVRLHGLRDGDTFVCVALTLTVGDDVSVAFVATEAAHRGQGLASRLVRAVLADARRAGMRSATLQASPDGLPVWERLGFRTVATMRGYLRPPQG